MSVSIVIDTSKTRNIIEHAQSIAKEIIGKILENKEQASKSYPESDSVNDKTLVINLVNSAVGQVDEIMSKVAQLVSLYNYTKSRSL